MTKKQQKPARTQSEQNQAAGQAEQATQQAPQQIQPKAQQAKPQPTKQPQNQTQQATQQATQQPQAQQAAQQQTQSKQNQQRPQQQKVQQTEQPQQKQPQQRPKLKATENVVMVGVKPAMAYVLAVMTQFNNGKGEVSIKARGRAISRAVDVAEIVRNRFAKDTKVKEIRTGTDKVRTQDGRELNVSTINIVLAK